MSTGLVICSTCRREVHQDSRRSPLEKGWYHCDDGTPRCAGAHSAYPQTADEVRGPACCADGPLPAQSPSKEPS
jgi:hypothetical protein